MAETDTHTHTTKKVCSLSKALLGDAREVAGICKKIKPI